MIQLRIGADGVPSERKLRISNKWENIDEIIKFELPEYTGVGDRFEDLNKYVIAVFKSKTEKYTVISPIINDEWRVPSKVTHIDGNWYIYLMARSGQIDLSQDDINIVAEEDEHVFISDGVLGIVSSNLIDGEFEDTPDENLNVLYNDLLSLRTDLINRINGINSFFEEIKIIAEANLEEAKEAASQAKESLEEMNGVKEYVDSKLEELETKTTESKELIDEYVESSKVNIDEYVGDKYTVIDEKIESDLSVAKESLSVELSNAKESLDSYKSSKEDDLSSYVDVLKEGINSYKEEKEEELELKKAQLQGSLESFTSDMESSLYNKEVDSLNKIDSKTLDAEARISLFEQSKEEELQSVYSQKVSDINDYTASKKSELSNHSVDMKDSISAYTDSKKSEIDEHTNTELNESISVFNSNAGIKTEEFNTNAESKTKDMVDALDEELGDRIVFEDEELKEIVIPTMEDIERIEDRINKNKNEWVEICEFTTEATSSSVVIDLENKYKEVCILIGDNGNAPSLVVNSNSTPVSGFVHVRVRDGYDIIGDKEISYSTTASIQQYDVSIRRFGKILEVKWSNHNDNIAGGYVRSSVRKLESAGGFDKVELFINTSNAYLINKGVKFILEGVRYYEDNSL